MSQELVAFGGRKMTLGEQIKQAREKKNLSQEVLELSIETGEDKSAELSGKYKLLMIVGWGLAVIFAISTIILSIMLYQNKKTNYYLPQESVIEDMSGDQGITGTDSNSETMYIYYDDGTATEEKVKTYNYSPNEE